MKVKLKTYTKLNKKFNRNDDGYLVIKDFTIYPEMEKILGNKIDVTFYDDYNKTVFLNGFHFPIEVLTKKSKKKLKDYKK